MKTCILCNTEKPLTEFYRHPQMADGRLGRCKECHKEAVRLNYRANKPKYQLYDQARAKTPSRKAMLLEYQRQRRQRFPMKAVAWNAVNNAVRDGRLKRQPCEVCGATEVEAHHPDYSRPLDVRWLCFKHHRETHGQMVG